MNPFDLSLLLNMEVEAGAGNFVKESSETDMEAANTIVLPAPHGTDLNQA